MALLRCMFVAELVCLGFLAGCSKKEPPPAETKAALPLPMPVATTAVSAAPVLETPPPPPEPVEVPVPGPAAVAAGASGTLTVAPSPVPICDKTGVGIATVKWTIAGTKYAEVRIDAPTGTLFAATKVSGAQKTGPWVRKGTTFYLQNGAEGGPESTMARLTPDVAPGGPCP